MIQIGDSWAVKRPDNYESNDDWDRLINFLNSSRKIDLEGTSDQYYGVTALGRAINSPYKETFGRIVTLSEATEFILSTEGRNFDKLNYKRDIFSDFHTPPFDYEE